MLGVRFILGLSAGNGEVERAFGKSRATFTALRKMNRLGIATLKCNAGRMGIAGYACPDGSSISMGEKFEDDEDDCVDDLFFGECADLVEDVSSTDNLAPIAAPSQPSEAPLTPMSGHDGRDVDDVPTSPPPGKRLRRNSSPGA